MPLVPRLTVVASAALLLVLAGCTASVDSDGGARPTALPGPRTTAAASTPTISPHPAPPKPKELAGTSAWKLTKPALKGQIQGYAAPISVTPGGRVRLMVSTRSHHFRAYAYRIGGFRGGFGRLVWKSRPLAGTRQPASSLLPRTRTVTTHWSPSATVRTRGWPSGFYLFKLVASSGYQAYIPFTVRSPSTRGKVVLAIPEMDWQAYNTWGGYDLYQAPPGHYRSWAVSFDRPFTPPGANQFLYNVLPTAVLAERMGVPLAYETDIDIAAHPNLLRGASGYVSVGHDEYWTEPERRHVTAARNAGTNLAFLSSNTMYWRVRLRGTPLGPNRLVVGYKTDAATNDPLRHSHPALLTSRWRDPPDADPENSLTGTLYECYPVNVPYRVASPNWWGFRGTGVHAGSKFPHLVADEADRVYPIPSTPRPLHILSYLRYSCGGVMTSTESTYYTTPSGAGVIDFGTQRWTCALRKRCYGLPKVDNSFARRVTKNVLRAYAGGPVGRTHPAHNNIGSFWLPKVNQVPAS